MGWWCYLSAFLVGVGLTLILGGLVILITRWWR